MEIPFSIPVSGVILLDGNSITITVNKTETSISLDFGVRPRNRLSLEPGKTMYDIILEAAQDVVRKKGFNRFSAAEVYGEALNNYPQLKRNSFMSRIIASTPDHNSNKHYASKRDYFSHIGPGLYKLNEQYISDRATEDIGILRNR